MLQINKNIQKKQHQTAIATHRSYDFNKEKKSWMQDIQIVNSIQSIYLINKCSLNTISSISYVKNGSEWIAIYSMKHFIWFYLYYEQHTNYDHFNYMTVRIYILIYISASLIDGYAWYTSTSEQHFNKSLFNNS